MAETTLTETMVPELLAELEDPKIREVNERHGDDHGVNLGKLRAVAKRLKTQQELARQLWATDDTAARLLALLICRPKAFERAELDVMLRESRTPGLDLAGLLDIIEAELKTPRLACSGR